MIVPTLNAKNLLESHKKYMPRTSASKTNPVKKVKIAHIITLLELGGAQQNTLYCCAHHHSDRYEVVLIAGKGGYLDTAAQQLASQIKVYFLSSLKRPIQLIWDFIAVFQMWLILKKEKVTIVHTHSSKAGILGRWAAWCARVPVIIHTVHGWGFHPEQSGGTRSIYQLLEKWTAKITSKIITVSMENQKTGLQLKIGQEPQYQVIHSGIELRPFMRARQHRVKYRQKMKLEGKIAVLILSNFKPQKAPQDVIQIGLDLKEKINQFVFMWAGDGENRLFIEQKIQVLGLQDHFRFLGWRTDIPELVAASDVLLLTSIFEGLPRSVLQAMAGRKPVIATAVNGTPEAVSDHHSGFLHAPHDTHGMAQSLKWIQQHPALAQKLGMEGSKRLVGSFRIEVMLQEIEALYETFLSSN